MKPVFVSTCDIWKSSCCPTGVFTNRTLLDKFLRRMIEETAIKINDDAPDTGPLEYWSIKELHDFIDFISIKEIELNEKF